MSKHARPKPKFKVGQVVIMIGHDNLPFKILDVIWEGDMWFYKWNRNNAAAENMLRKLTNAEVSG